MAAQSFSKSERLVGIKIFQELFNSGEQLSAYPFRLVWSSMPFNKRFPSQLGISVPKRSFAKAVQRNRLKRRIREAFRKNKELLYEILLEKNRSIAVVMIYVAKEEMTYQELEKKLVVSLQKLGKAIT